MHRDGEGEDKGPNQGYTQNKNSHHILLNFYEIYSGLDKNKDNKITKTDLAQHLAAKRVNESIFA